MVNRLLNVPLNQTDYNTEVNTIKYIAQENGYDPQLIESLVKNAKRRKLQNNNKETHTDKTFITLTHHNKSTQKIAKTIKKLEYNIAYITNNTLKRHLTNKTTHNTIHEKHTSTGVLQT